MKMILRCGGAFCLLALAACGGSIDQSVGDGASGAGGSNNTQGHAGNSSAQPLGGSRAQPLGGSSNGSGNAPTQLGGSNGSGASSSGRGGAAWGPGTCDPPCSQGFGCYEVANDPAGFCAPLCDTPEQGQTADADLSCSNSILGGAGTCVFSLGFGWPLPGGNDIPFLTSRVVTGLCSNACDPILQDCPEGYTCDQTATYSAVSQQGLYACLPNKGPHAVGEACDDAGDGQCGPGLTCSVPPDGNIFAATCAALCDRRDTDACSGTQTCAETIFTEQDNDPNIGVCL
jgi:hypothetical protein